MLVLVTGATGYIGGRLVPQLLAAGHRVRCLTRRPEKLAGVPWADDVEIVAGDALDPERTAAAMDGVDVVYYLVHSIGTGAEFAESDRLAAQNVADRAAETGVQRIVYLGGLVPHGEEASPHLASRAEVGQIFLDGPVPAIVLQAAVIIGSGSASFEMLRYLTERLPVMVTPKWASSRVQPIAVRDVLTYLVGVLDLPPGTNRRYDIAGPDVLTYREMMQRFAQVAGLKKRVIVPVPVLTPWLSSHWINLVTPVPKAIAQPLIESLRNSVVATEHDLAELLPFAPLGFDEAVRRALQRVRAADVPTRWSGASWPGAASDPLPTDPEWSGGTVYRDDRETAVHAAPTDVWRAIEGIGGERGLVLVPARMGGARPHRPALRRRRPPPRPPASRPAGGRRGGRLLAGRTDRARPSSPPACGDEAPGRRLARVHPRRHCRRAAPAPAGAGSYRAVWPGPCTGGRSPRSTGWCSARCCATSPTPPRRTQWRRTRPRPERLSPRAGAPDPRSAGPGSARRTRRRRR